MDPVKALGNGHERIQVPKPGGLVQPGPLVTVVAVSQGTPKGVILRVEHTAGMNIFVLDPDHAETLGQNLIRNAKQARSGLTIPPGGLVK